MSMVDVSFLIPARNEMFLAKTVESLLSRMELNSEIIVIADGMWPDPPIADDPRVHVVYRPQSIGQRAGTNEAARLSSGRYVCKIDAHCDVEPGFDRKMVEAGEKLGPNVTQIPAMYNLHAFNWQCPECSHESYQGPTPTRCDKCGRNITPIRKMIWKKRDHKRTEFWRFDHTLHFQYWGEFKERPESKDPIVDVMSSIGACFFMRRDRFFEIGGLDESHGSWGQFGTEIACKSWLSGGRHVVNRETYFVHMFRTQGGDFGFPYPMSGRAVERARTYSRQLWMENRWPQQVLPLSWLVNKFAPIPGWHETDGREALERVQAAGRAFELRGTVAAPMHAVPQAIIDGAPDEAEPVDVAPSEMARPEPPARPVEDVPTYAKAPVPDLGTSFVYGPRSMRPVKGLVYYSDCRGDERVLKAVREQLKRVADGMPLVSVTLDPVAFGFNRVLPLERGYLTMFKQILSGLDLLDADFAYLVEHDVLYHGSHFSFTPESRHCYYYNQNVWKVDAESGHALHYLCSQTSGLCADRDLLRQHYRTRVESVARNGFSRKNGFEPGTRKIRHGGFDDFDAQVWMSEVPNVDVRHGHNLTPSRWRQDQFRNQKFCQGWTEGDGVPGWGTTKGRFFEFLSDLSK